MGLIKLVIALTFTIFYIHFNMCVEMVYANMKRIFFFEVYLFCVKSSSQF